MDNINPDPRPEEENKRIDIPEDKLGFLRGILTFLLLVVLIVGSFWVSFNLGKKILAPAVKKEKIDVTMPAPPPEIARMQGLEELTMEGKAQAKPMPVCRTAVPSRGYYKVQAGVFAVKNNAVNLSSKLQAGGYSTFIKSVRQGWRVQVGAYKTRTAAKKLQSSLKSKGFESIIIYE